MTRFFSSSFSSQFFLFCAFCSSLLLFSGCEEAPTETAVSEENIPKENIILSTPDDWEVIPKETYPANLILAKREPSFSQETPSMVSIAVEKSLYPSLQKFAYRNIETVRKKSQDFQKISEQDILLSNETPAFFIEYSDRYSKTKERLSFYDLYVQDLKEEKSYVITLLFDPTTSEEHKEFLRNILFSFSLFKEEVSQ